MWISDRGESGGPSMWIIFIFYNIILKYQNVDKDFRNFTHKYTTHRHCDLETESDQ